MNSLPHCSQSVLVTNADSLLLFDLCKLHGQTSRNEVTIAVWKASTQKDTELYQSIKMDT